MTARVSAASAFAAAGSVRGNQSVRRARAALVAGVMAVPLLGAAGAAWGADAYWDIDGTTAGAGGATPNGQWDSTTANWGNSGGTAATTTWVAGDVAIFSAGTNATGTFGVNVSGAQTAGGITVQEGVLTLSGDTITLTGATVSAGTATTINNVLAGSVGLTKAGGSTLTLGNANTYSGGTTVSAGTLVISQDAALGVVPGSAADDVFVAATLRGNGTFTLDANRTVVVGPTNGTGSGTGTFDVTTGNTMTIAGAVKANGSSTAALTKTGAGTLVLGGNVSHTGALNANAGTLLVTGNGSWGGTTSVNGGVLTLSGSNALTGATTVANGTLNLDYTVNNNDKVNSGGLLTVNHLGVVNVIGSGTGATSQAVNGLTLGTNGAATVNVTHGTDQDATLNVGTITRGTGAVLSVTAGGAGTGTAKVVTTNAGTNGLLGGYATFGTDTWAAVDGSGAISGLAAYDTDDFTGAGTRNTDVTADQSPAAGASVNSVRFGAPVATVTLSGANTITTGGILVTSAGGGGLTGGTLTSGTGDVVVHQNNAGAEFTLGSEVTGAVGITKAGPGTMVLAGANTNTGPLTVVAGTVRLGASERVTNGAAVVVSTGATLDLNGNNETVGNLSGFGAISASGNLTTGNNTAAATYSGPLSGGGTLTKVGTGTQTLSGTSSGYTGPVQVNAGVLSVTSAQGLGTADNGTTVADGAALQVSGTVTIAEPLTVSGTGVGNAGVIRKTANNTTTLSGGTTLNGPARINSDAGTLTFGTAPVNNNGHTLTIGGAGNVTIATTSRIEGAGQLVKEGAGTLLLANNNSNYTGKTVINGGTVQYNFQVGTGVGPLGPNPASPVADFITLNGGTLINAATGNAGSSLETNKGVYLGVNGGTWSIADPTTTNIHIYRGIISGPGGFTKSGGAIFAFTGVYTYGGPTTVAQGILRLRNEASFGTGQLPSTTDLTISSGATFDIATFAQTVNSLAGAGSLVAAAGSAQALTLGGTNVSPVTFAGNITSTAAGDTSLKLTKDGPGVQVLSGTNRNTGDITVNGGVLQFATAGSLGGSGANMTVNAGGTAAAGYAMDQSFLGRIVTTSGGVAALAADSANNLDVSSFADLRLGAVGTATYSGTLTAGTAYKLGGGKGTLKLANPIVDGKDLSVGDNGTGGGTVALSGTNRFGALTVGVGKLDVGTGRLVLTGTAQSALRGMLQAGRNETGGVALWNGDGVISSAAAANAQKITGIGYLTAADKGLTGGTWGGVGPLAATDVITMYTYNGDITLNGVVDQDDLALLDKAFALYGSGAIPAGSAVWLNGDFDFDGAVTMKDYFLADTAFAGQSGGLSAGMLAQRGAQFGEAYVSQLVAAVPEPGVGVLVAGGALVMGGRRRGRGR